MPSGDVKRALARPAHERVLDRVVVEQDGCWLWQGAHAAGYGRIRVGSRTDGTRRTEQTHRVVYEAIAGPIPEGLVLDHLCRVTLCCNPRHLEPVTQQENTRRMVLCEAERQRRSEWMISVNARRWAA